MTQIATVEKILPGGMAEISVPRKSACGHDCEECAGCGVTGAAVHARASNPIGARPGQKVVVESSTKNMLRIVVLKPTIICTTAVFMLVVCAFTVAAIASISSAIATLTIVWFCRMVVPAELSI